MKTETQVLLAGVCLGAFLFIRSKLDKQTKLAETERVNSLELTDDKISTFSILIDSSQDKDRTKLDFPTREEADLAYERIKAQGLVGLIKLY